MSLSNKREELLKTLIKDLTYTDKNYLSEIFKIIEEQDKEFIEEVKQLHIKYDRFTFLTELDKLSGDKLTNHSPKGKDHKSSSCNEMLVKDNRVSALQSADTDGVNGNTLPSEGEMEGSIPSSADTKKEKSMKINISEKAGELNFGVFWISLDGRLSTEWFQKYLTAKAHHDFIKSLGRQPSINVRLENIK